MPQGHKSEENQEKSGKTKKYDRSQEKNGGFWKNSGNLTNLEITSDFVF